MAVAMAVPTNKDDSIARQLDQEIEALRSQVKALKSHRATLATTILSSRTSQSILTRLRSKPAGPSLPSATTTTTTPNDTNPLQQAQLFENSSRQLALNQECLYRTCAGITTFKVQDPDPRALDSGRVLGLRIEAFASGRFVRPYYVFLVRPLPGIPSVLKIHRHTVPPCIPLAALASRYLPQPHAGDVPKPRVQDLSRLVRALRREIAGYHNRLAVIAGMRRGFGLDGRQRRNKGKGRDFGVRDVAVADAEGRQIRFEWSDGRIGRAVMDDAGMVRKCVVIGEGGRDREMERRVLGGDGRVEGVVERLGG